MSSRHPPKPASPAAHHVPLGAALHDNEALGSLLSRVRKSQERYQCIAPLLPPGLQTAVKAGVLDEAGWSLLADNAATAAKVRQLLPALTEALVAQGWPALPIRLRLQARR
jgi:hypothetical protein